MLTSAFAAPELPEGTHGWTTCGPDWTIVDHAYGWFLGDKIRDVPGVWESFGPDLEYVMAQRLPLEVRRMWNGSVWHAVICPWDDGGIKAWFSVLLKITPADLLTLSRYLSLSHQIADVLVGGPAPGAPVPLSAVEAPRSHPRALLRVLPAPE